MEENNPHVLGNAPIGKLLLQYSIPAIIGMTLTSLYNIIDSIFIGHGVGALAISGLAITFPLMNLLIAFCTLVGVGGYYFVYSSGTERYKRSGRHFRKCYYSLYRQCHFLRRNHTDISG